MKNSHCSDFTDISRVADLKARLLGNVVGRAANPVEIG
jgi:hypothetical protein